MADDTPPTVESLALRLMNFLAKAEMGSRSAGFQTQVYDRPAKGPPQSRPLGICERYLATHDQIENRLWSMEDVVAVIERREELRSGGC